jgi:hypothetical protein
MTVTLLVAIPLALLGVVALLAFAGCVLPAYEYVEDFKKYSDETVLANAHCVAYWPLRETKDTDPAADLKGTNPGAYVDPTTASTVFPPPADIYPWPAVSVPDMPQPDESAAADGTLNMGQPGLLNGDLVPDTDNRTTCIQVDGAFVSVPFNAVINPASFTIEVWVRVDWHPNTDPAAFRAVLDCRETANGGKGFSLFANEENVWEVRVGNGSTGASEFTILQADKPIVFGTPDDHLTFYLAVTYDAATQALVLFVDGGLSAAVSTAYVPNTSSALFIGAGMPFLPLRPPQPPLPPDTLAGPLFPFKGEIQCVALYDAALDLITISNHKANGDGAVVPPSP